MGYKVKRMGRTDKLIERLKARPKDFTWNEFARLMRQCGYSEAKHGSSSGSRYKFISESGAVVSMHRPHPRGILKQYQIDQVIEHLEKKGHI